MKWPKRIVVFGGEMGGPGGRFAFWPTYRKPNGKDVRAYQLVPLKKKPTKRRKRRGE